MEMNGPDEYLCGRDNSMDGSGGPVASRVRELLALGRGFQKELEACGGRPGVARLQKLVRAELSFLSRLAALPLSPDLPSCPALRSSNLDHLVNVFRVMQHPLVTGVSAVMQSLPIGETGSAHLDIACIIDGKPVWLVMSSRNPRYLHWLDLGKGVKGLKGKVVNLLQAACANVVRQPESIILCFAGEVQEDVLRGLIDEFGATHEPSVIHKQHSSRSAYGSNNLNHLQLVCDCSEVEGGDWLEVEVRNDSPRWNEAWESYTIPIQNYDGQKTEDSELVHVITHSNGEITAGKDNEGCFLPSLSQVNSDQQTRSVTSVEVAPVELAFDSSAKFLNLDTTALVALVSEVSNGGAAHMSNLPQEDLEKRFPSMSAFIREQAMSELESPLKIEIEEAIASHQPLVSKFVYDEFCSIVSQIGGPKENDRADALLQRVRVVSDRPSNRVMSLPLSGRIKRRHKIVFGTGDFYNAPTLTANMAFVRAARDKGMAIATIEHRPRALTGD